MPGQVDKRDRKYKKLPSTVGHDGISTLPRADRIAAKRKKQIIEQVGGFGFCSLARSCWCVSMPVLAVESQV